MGQFTTEQRFYLVERRLRRVSMDECRQQFLAHFGVPAPSPKAIYKMVKKMEDSHTCHNENAGRSGRPTTVRTFENVIKVVESVAALP